MLLKTFERRLEGAMSFVRRPVSPKARLSENVSVGRPYSPKARLSEGPLVRRPVSPKARLSEGPLVS